MSSISPDQLISSTINSIDLDSGVSLKIPKTSHERTKKVRKMSSIVSRRHIDSKVNQIHKKCFFKDENDNIVHIRFVISDNELNCYDNDQKFSEMVKSIVEKYKKSHASRSKESTATSLNDSLEPKLKNNSIVCDQSCLDQNGNVEIENNEICLSLM